MLHNRHFKPMLAIALALCATAAPAATALPITTGPACSACEYGPLVDFARVPRAPARTAAASARLPPATAAPAKVIVRDSGFAWGDAAAGAGATLVIVMLGAGAATAAIRRNRVPSRVSTTS